MIAATDVAFTIPTSDGTGGVFRASVGRTPALTAGFARKSDRAIFVALATGYTDT